MRRYAGKLIGIPAQNGLFDGVDIGILVCGQIQARKNAFAILEDVDAEGYLFLCVDVGGACDALKRCK